MTDIRTAAIESLRATANMLHSRPHENMNHDWAECMVNDLAEAGLLRSENQAID